MKFEFNGIISESYEFDQILIGGECLSRSADVFDGNLSTVKYWLSNEAIDDVNVIENELTAFYKGQVEANGYYLQGSEWTGIYGANDKLSIGEHDLIHELTSHIGEYCYLIIETI